MKSRKSGETDAAYIARLEAANAGLKTQNKSLNKWASNINFAVTILACEGSLAFQAMAEKAGVRGHPSVSKAVELFDKISHPQWRDESAAFPKIEFPSDWDLDGPEVQSGDADMALNSPINDAIELLNALIHRTPKGCWDDISKVTGGLQQALQKRVAEQKLRAGFRPKSVAIAANKHFREMEADELASLVDAMSWMALDLAQDMNYANECLRRDLRASSYRRIGADLYALSSAACSPPPGNIDIKVFGGETVPF